MKLTKAGVYALIETPKRTKILILNKVHPYAWIEAGKVGEILVASTHPHTPAETLAVGRFKLYELEIYPTGRQLLELEVGRGSWQWYILPTGLPKGQHWRAKIIPSSLTTTPAQTEPTESLGRRLQPA